jgi:hypothetical protein
VLARLEDEAARRGLNYVYNTVRDAHPQRDDVHDWLAVRGYRGSTSDTTLRKRVAARDQRPAPDGGTSSAAPSSSVVYDPATSRDRAPGHEESGGYVDVDEHQY